MARIIEEESSTPVPCETNPTGQNGVVLYDGVTYALSSHNSSAVGEGLQRLWSSDEVHHQEEDPVLWPCGHTGRHNAHLSHCPVCQSETTHRETESWSNGANEDGSEENFFRWSRHVGRVGIVLTGVILLIIVRKFSHF